MSRFGLVKSLSWSGKLGRRMLKRFLYTQMAVWTAVKILIGREMPLLPFRVEDDPPSIYWVFRLKPAGLTEFSQKLKLPPQFKLTPIRCLATDEPEYWLTLNVYRVSGLANGIRAEWSVYVEDEAGESRYMVVDARSSQMSMDPVDVITPASRVAHERTGQVIETVVGDEGASFVCKIDVPDSVASVAPAAAEWVTANDYIYWGNGICDRTFYGGSLAYAKQRRYGGEVATITDQSIWAEFVEPDPAHILIFDHAIEFVVSPWENVDHAPIFD